jgi:cystathionine beta-lyase
MVDHGVFGYGFDDPGYRDAVCWWQSTRHGWSVDPDWIVTTQGLGHAIGMILDTFTDPVRRLFLHPGLSRVPRQDRKGERRPVEIPMARDGDRYVLDFDAAEAAMDHP